MVIQAAIFKIGGKILDNSKNLINTIAQLTQLFEDEIIKRIILISGGGVLANFVRSIYNEFRINDELAHWIAIYSMNYNGIELKRKFPHLMVSEKFTELEKIRKSFSIFLPYKFLEENDELPHTWDVTSDSIALYLAKKFGLKECFLIKDVDGIIDSNQTVINEISTYKFRQYKCEGKFKEINSKELDIKIGTRPVDPYLLTLIDKYKIPCIILNGANQNPRIFKYFTLTDKKDKVFTKLYSV